MKAYDRLLRKQAIRRLMKELVEPLLIAIALLATLGFLAWGYLGLN